MRKDEDPHINLEDVIQLEQYYGVSHQAMLNQLIDIGLTVIGVDSRVTFTGGAVYASSRGTEPARQFEGTSTCRVTFYAEGAAHPFHLVSEDGSGIYGWVDENAVHLG